MRVVIWKKQMKAVAETVLSSCNKLQAQISLSMLVALGVRLKLLMDQLRPMIHKEDPYSLWNSLGGKSSSPLWADEYVSYLTYVECQHSLHYGMMTITSQG